MYTRPLVTSNILLELPESLAKEDGKFMNVPNVHPVCQLVTLHLCFRSRCLLTMAPFTQVGLHPRASSITLMIPLEPQ